MRLRHDFASRRNYWRAGARTLFAISSADRKPHWPATELGYLRRHDLSPPFADADQDDGPDLITQEQATTIRRLCEETNMPVEKFCEWAKIDAVPDLLARNFDKAVLALQQRTKRQQA